MRGLITRGDDYQACAKCSASEYVFILTKPLISPISKSFYEGGKNELLESSVLLVCFKDAVL